MIPKLAIERAIAGKWKNRATVNLSPKYFCVNWEEIALDPTFWQALGKALGWKSYGTTQGWDWDKNAHTFYDLILTGGSTDEFWTDLLK